MIRFETLKRFIESAPPKRTIEFVLVYLRQDGEIETVNSWQKREVDEELGSADNFATIVIETAQNHCDQEELVCSYRFRSIAKNEKTISSLRLRVTPSDEKEDVLGIGNAQGNSAIQQLVRVIEAQLRIQVASVKTFQEGYRKLIDDQRLEINALRKREEKATEFAFSLIEASTDDEKEVQKTQLANKLGSVIEKVGEHMLGANIDESNNKPFNHS